MTVTPKIYNFPTIPIDKQVFYLPGLAADGGYTVGGAHIMSHEPGGFAFLDIQPAMQVNEYSFPETSWLMSRSNGQIMRVRLAPTPQVASALTAGVRWDGDLLWTNQQEWSGDYTATYLTGASEGADTLTVDLSALGQVLRRGHVIGHKYDCYMIDAISYDTDNIATITVMSAFRRDVTAGDSLLFRPFFTGMIVNGNALVQTYDSENAGMIQMPKITMMECIL